MAEDDLQSNNDQTLNSESDISIEALTIVTGTGNKVSVKEIMVETNIYEDIFTHSISCQMMLDDTLNMIEALPLCGQEWLFLRISKPGFQDTVDPSLNVKYNLILRVYKVAKVVATNERRMHYIVYATSERLVNSQHMVVGKSYKNVKPEVAIADILGNYLGASTSNKWVQGLEGSRQSYSFVVPNLKPFDAIKMITSHAINNVNGMKDFIFFENSEGYHLKSLTNLLNKSAAVAENRYYTIEYSNKNIITAGGSVNDINPFEYVFNPQSSETDVLFDQISSFNRGEFGTNMRHVGIAKAENKVYERSYAHFIEQKGSSFMNQYPKIPVNDWGEGTFSNGMRFLTFDTHPYLEASAPSVSFSNTGELRTERIMKFATLVDQKLKLHLPGNPFMKLGVLVNYKVPSIRARNDDDNGALDKYMSGNYLVTAIRHKFTRDRWDTFLEMSKDSLTNEIPQHYAQNYDGEI